MLDCFYPSLSALIAACREIRAYLRSGASSLPDKPQDYHLARVLPMYDERIRFVDGRPQVVYVCNCI